MLLGISLLFSCTSASNNTYNYLQDDKVIEQRLLSESSAPTKVLPGDLLIITVTGPDPSLLKTYNQNFSTTSPIPQSAPNPNGQTSTITLAGPTYKVNEKGYIDFSGIGEVYVEGKTLTEIQDDIRDRLSRYIKNHSVNVTMANFRVKVLGEVARGGTVVLPEAKGTLFDALANSGDITIYGDRKNVLVIRDAGNEKITGRLDLTSSEFMSSPFYNLKQGDVIYVPANKTKEKTSRLDPNLPIYVSTAGLLVTIIALLVK